MTLDTVLTETPAISATSCMVALMEAPSFSCCSCRGFRILAARWRAAATPTASCQGREEALYDVAPRNLRQQPGSSWILVLDSCFYNVESYSELQSLSAGLWFDA